MSSDSEDSRRRHKRKKYKKEKKRKKHRHSESEKLKRKRKKDYRRDYDSSSNSDNSVSSEEKYRKRSKKDHKAKKRERVSNERKLEKQRSKYDDFVPLIHELLSEQSNDDLATELPYLLIRLASGATLNLTQMPNQNVATCLGKIFSLLGCTDDGEGWKFDDGGNINHCKSGSDSSLVLVKLSRYLLEEQGITMEAIEKFENQDHSPPDAPDTETVGNTKNLEQNDIITEIASLTSMLLEKFQSERKDSESSLAKEVYSIMNMIAEGEIICLDGIPDEDLKMSMEKLFILIGLIKEEMEDDESEDECPGNDDDAKVATFGYVLPDQSAPDFDRVHSKLNAVLGACKNTHQKFMQTGKRMLGPSYPPSDSNMQSFSAFDQQNSDDEEEGPAPLGSAMAKKRLQNGPAVSSATVRDMAERRRAEMIYATSGVDITASTGNTREEWMMTPGEHDFLSGVLAKGIKSRGFRNDKNASRLARTSQDLPLEPKIQQEVNEIIKLHQDARGPSLVEQHREQKAKEKASLQKDEQRWDWNREKDLDAGRRVDKSHLRMVMGGASSDLKSKFQGGYGRE
jgi:hypothetical protein